MSFGAHNNNIGDGYIANDVAGGVLVGIPTMEGHHLVFASAYIVVTSLKFTNQIHSLKIIFRTYCKIYLLSPTP